MADRENTRAEIAVTAADGGLIAGSLVAVCPVPLIRRHVIGEGR